MITLQVMIHIANIGIVNIMIGEMYTSATMHSEDMLDIYGYGACIAV